MIRSKRPKKLQHLIYNPPKDNNGNNIWIPVVVKNRESLIYFIKGYQYTTYIYAQIFAQSGGKIEIKGHDFPISSETYNDTLMNGKKQRDLTDKELDDYYATLRENITEKYEKINNTNGENTVKCSDTDEPYFNIDCPGCGMPVLFAVSNEIPYDDLNCPMCERQLIDYTGHDECEFIYDGE